MVAADIKTGKRFGTIGLIKPNIAQAHIEEMLPFLPPGIAFAPTYLNFQQGSHEEFAAAMPVYERYIAILADQNCDLIIAEGAPPFMVQGHERETEIVNGWQKKYNVPIVTSSQTQVKALRALGVKRLVGTSYVSADLHKIFGKYFSDAGFRMMSFERFDASFHGAADVPTADIVAFVRKLVAQNPGAEAIYILGSGWRTLDVIEPIEAEFGIPVLDPMIVRVWEIQKRLGLHMPTPGFGRLIGELP